MKRRETLFNSTEHIKLGFRTLRGNRHVESYNNRLRKLHTPTILLQDVWKETRQYEKQPQTSHTHIHLCKKKLDEIMQQQAQVHESTAAKVRMPIHEPLNKHK